MIKISFRLLVVNPYYHPAAVYGGPVQSIHRRNKSLANLGCQIKTYTTDANGTADLEVPTGRPVPVDGLPVTYFRRWWFGREKKPFSLFFSPELGLALRRLQPGDYDLFLIHSLWDEPARLAAAAARRTGTPYICYTHGIFEPWRMKFKQYKKKVYMALVAGRMLQKAAGIVVCNDAEKEFLRAYGINAPIRRITWGVEPINPDDRPPKHVLEKHFPELNGNRFLLFLSRLHLMKGLDLLIPAFAGLAGSFPDWRLVVAGPDERGYKDTVLRMVESYGISQKIIFPGLVTGLKKQALLSHADIYTLPSYSEGFSMSVAEALGYGRPVVITNTCYVPEVTKDGMGVEVPPDKQALTEALREMMRNAGLRQICSENAHKFARQYFSWDSVGQETLKFLNECLNPGA